MAHLRHIRLQKVRVDLLHAGPDETVTSILARWGITQFGRDDKKGVDIKVD